MAAFKSGGTCLGWPDRQKRGESGAAGEHDKESRFRHAYKTPEQLVRTLVGAAGRGANFLLNTGPMPNGKLQPENLATLAEIGGWLKTHGESIYGTRGGPVPPQDWGVTTAGEDGTIYVHLLDWEGGTLRLPVGATGATLLAGGAPVPMRRVEGGIELDVAAKPEGEWDRIVVLKR